MQKLNIALVSPYPFTKEPGGVKDFILGFKEALVRANCNVWIIAPEAKDMQKELIDFTLGIGFKVSTEQTEFWISVSRKKTAKEIIDKIKPDILVIHEPFVPSAGHTFISTVNKIKRNRPLIIGQFHARRENFNWWLNVVEYLARHFVRRPTMNGNKLELTKGYVATINDGLDGRITVSNATREFIEAKIPAKYKVIANGIDIEKLKPNGSKIINWKKNKETIILFAGRHDPRKGIENLLTALVLLLSKGLGHLRLKITGVGETTNKVLKLVNKLNLQKYVEFTGVLSYEDLIRAYRTTDLVAAPSLEGEGFNRTIIEARACGALVVCTDIKGQNEAIGDDLAKFMAKKDDPQDLANKIEKILSLAEEEKRKIIDKSTKEVRKKFCWDFIVQQHLNYYRSLLDGS